MLWLLKGLYGAILTLTITVTSDTHGLTLPPAPLADVLVHCGDFTNYGRPDELIKFGTWMAAQPHKHKILIYGNHEVGIYKAPSLGKQTLEDLIPGVHILFDSGVEIEGIKFWGSPWTPEFCGWAFMKEELDLMPHWDAIPDDTNVLITHGPAYGGNGGIVRSGTDAGSKTLLSRVLHLPKLLLHVSGHLHEDFGIRDVFHSTHKAVNAAYAESNKMFRLTIDNGQVILAEAI